MKKHLKYIERSAQYGFYIARSIRNGEFVGKTPLQAARFAWRAAKNKLEYGVARTIK